MYVLEKLNGLVNGRGGISDSSLGCPGEAEWPAFSGSVFDWFGSRNPRHSTEIKENQITNSMMNYIGNDSQHLWTDVKNGGKLLNCVLCVHVLASE